jgi:trehalose 6-phosphate phosphatase
MIQSLPAPPRLPAADVALFLDVDGTLVEIEKEPGAVHVPEQLCQVLAELQLALDGALALVSGRPISQLDRLFSPLRLAAAGLHGLERRHLPARMVRAEVVPSLFDGARQELAHFAARHDGVLLEDKGLTLALHYRNAPHQQDAAAATAKAIAAASGGALTLLEGKMVFELKPPGYDKGQAIVAFMAESPFTGRRPVFAGDDVTDEAGFAAVAALGGIAIRIGDDDRPTAAGHGLADVAATQRWLQGILAAEAA